MLSDPFQTVYEGTSKALGSFGQAIQLLGQQYSDKKQKEREFQEKKELLSEEYKLKQQYKDPLETLKDTLEIEKIRKELSGEITDKDTLNRATTLRKEFNTDQVYKNFQILQRSEDQMKEAYKLATSPTTQSRVAADQAIAVTFQKMLDPQSVVRESEYARTPEGVAFMNRMGSIVEQMQKGGLRLKDSDRLSLIQAANKLLKSGKRQMNSHIGRYKSLAKDYQVKPELILGDIDEFDVGRTFMLNGEPYDIPESEADEFLKENPTAQEIY